MEKQKYIILTLDDEHYAIPIDNIQTIERLQTITRIPNTEEFVKGVINLRGIITPVIDLRERMGLSAKVIDEHSRIIIVNNQQESIGMIVDEANDVVEITPDQIESPPETISRQYRSYIEGVVKHHDRLIVLLSLDQVFDIELVKND